MLHQFVQKNLWLYHCSQDFMQIVRKEVIILINAITWPSLWEEENIYSEVTQDLCNNLVV